MKRLIMRLLGYVEVEEPAHYGTPWPPRTHWAKARDIPPWPMTAYEREGGCTVKMRAPGGISMWNGCHLDAGHDGDHRWSVDIKPSSVHPEGEHYEGTFTTEAACASWGRRASIAELEAYEAGTLPGTTVAWRK